MEKEYGGEKENSINFLGKYATQSFPKRNLSLGAKLVWTLYEQPNMLWAKLLSPNIWHLTWMREFLL